MRNVKEILLCSCIKGNFRFCLSRFCQTCTTIKRYLITIAECKLALPFRFYIDASAIAIEHLIAWYWSIIHYSYYSILNYDCPSRHFTFYLDDKWFYISGLPRFTSNSQIIPFFVFFRYENVCLICFYYLNRSKDEELHLVDVDKFYADAPAEISRQVWISLIHVLLFHYSLLSQIWMF